MWNMRRPHFLVGFDPTLCSERLNIPYNFVKYMRGTAPGKAGLVGPSGNKWLVDLIVVENGLFLNDGWADFVKDHLLERGDSIVFRYDGELNFTLQIFDRSMCENEAAFSAENSHNLSKYDSTMVKKRDRERSALLDSIIEGARKKMRCSQLHAESTYDKRENNADLVWMQKGDGNSSMKNAVTVALPLAVIHDQPDPSARYGHTNLDILLSASEAERIAQSYKSSFPSFLKVMKRFNISGSYTLNVPYKFATAHLPNCKVKIVLRNLKGECWTVNSIPTTKETSHTFCGGWLSFVRDNNIDLGDICIFELMHKFELQVRILRVGKESLDGRDGEADHGSRNNGCTTTPNKMSKRKPKKKSESAHSMENSALSSLANNCIVESEMLTRFSAPDRQGFPTKGCVSMKSAPEERMAAQYFVSSFPHFVRIMKKFNVSDSYTLKIPYQFSMEHLPDSKTEIVLQNLSGRCWTVNSIPTIKVPTLHTLHTFCGGWMAFVRDNNLQIGDICIFELVGKCEMRVHVCGIGKKGD